GETEYALRLLPIGGYCAMEGEEEESDDPHSLGNQSFLKKVFIFAAGAAMNFLIGFLIILVLYSGVQAFYSTRLVGFAPEFTLTGEAGLQQGDILYKVDGERIYLYSDLELFFSRGNGKSFDLVVERNGEKVALNDFPLVKKEFSNTDGKPYQGYGLYFGYEEASVLSKLKYSWYNTVDFVRIIRYSLQELVRGNAGMDDLSGPVGIVTTIVQVGEESESARDAVDNILYFAALIAINLAVMNLLPIPALDGGKIFFLTINTISRKLFHRQIPEKYENYIHATGFVLLMGLMLVVTFHDVLKHFV
ncbi:MAG: M50 family metallopeptidase, partial [Ruthenibacterium sp.]